MLALTALVEAEGRLLRQQVGRTAVAVMLIGLVSLLVAAAIGFGMAGLYYWLAPYWGTAGALAALGGLCLLIAAVLGGWAYRWLRR